MPDGTAARVLRFLGLSELAEIAHGDAASFPLGVLYPYSRDLQRVCTCYDAVCEQCPEAASILLGETLGKVAALNPRQSAAVKAYLGSMATLYGRIAFAPGPGGGSVGAAYQVASDAVVDTTHRGQRRKAERTHRDRRPQRGGAEEGADTTAVGDQVDAVERLGAAHALG